MASNVLALNSSVPTHWIEALHQDGSSPKRRPRATVASRSSSVAASVKKIEPAKKTTASAPTPTSSTKPGKGPMKKHSEPTAKPSAIARSQATLVAGRGPIASAWPITGPRYGRAGRARITRGG